MAVLTTLIFPEFALQTGKFYNLIPSLYLINELLELSIKFAGIDTPAGLKRFDVIPKKTIKPNFVHYNIAGFSELLNRRIGKLNERIKKRNIGQPKHNHEDKIKKLPQRVSTIAEARDLFARVFKFHHLERNGKKFAFEISTDAVRARVRMRKRIGPENREILESEVAVALDPGFKLMFAAVSECQRTGFRQFVLYSSKKFHHLAGKNRRNILQVKWTESIEDRMRRDRQKKKIWCNGRRLQNHKLLFFEQKKSVTFKKKLKRLRQNQDICRQKILRAIVSSLCPPGLTTTVYYGDGIHYPRPRAPLGNFRIR